MINVKRCTKKETSDDHPEAVETPQQNYGAFVTGTSYAEKQVIRTGAASGSAVVD